MYVNHAVNFYLYCLTGKRFRKELAAMLSCSRVKRMCLKGANETTVVGGEVAVRNGRRDVDLHQQYAGRMAQPSSTSSRTRSGRLMMNVNPLRKSSSELNNERYSWTILASLFHTLACGSLQPERLCLGTFERICKTAVFKADANGLVRGNILLPFCELWHQCNIYWTFAIARLFDQLSGAQYT